MFDAGFHIHHHALVAVEQQMVQHLAEQDVLGTGAAAFAAFDGAHHQHAHAVHCNSELLGNVIHARVHAQEAAPSLAAADALFDQRFQFDQWGDGRAAVTERPRQVGVGIRIHCNYPVAKLPPAAGQ